MNRDHLNKIDAILKEVTDSGFAAGTSCLIMENGEEAYYGESGYIDIEKGIKVKRDSIFRLYSMSKPVTGAAVMCLVEDGLLDLNLPVGDFIPTFKNQVVADKYDRYQVKRAMKVKDLLNMTGGLTYGGDLNSPEAYTAMIADDGISRIGSDHEMTTLEFATRLGELPLIFDPGESFQYSYSADVLGAIIEVITGKRFGEYLRERLLEPLGMNDTGFYVPAEKQSRLTKVYEKTAEGLKEFKYNHLCINLPMDHEPGFQSGGAGLCSTLDDYAKFATMLLNKGVYNGKRIMQEGTVKYFTEANMQAGPRKELMRWDGMDGYDYANLLRIMKRPGDALTLTSMGEYGWDGWLGPYFINDPVHKVTILVMLQLTGAGTTTYTRRVRNVVYSCCED